MMRATIAAGLGWGVQTRGACAKGENGNSGGLENIHLSVADHLFVLRQWALDYGAVALVVAFAVAAGRW